MKWSAGHIVKVKKIKQKKKKSIKKKKKTREGKFVILDTDLQME